MNNFKSSFIFLAIGVLLGGYIYFFERGPVKKDDEKVKLFPTYVADDVQEIKIQNPRAKEAIDQKLIDLKKDDKGNWDMLSPENLKADEPGIRSLLSNVGDITPDDSVSNPANLTDYGLNTTAAQATIVFKNGTANTLLIGDKNVVGSSVYLKLINQNVVYLVPSYTVESLTKKVNDYRDHSVLTTDTVLAQRVRLIHSGKVLEIEKDKENNWNLIKPFSSKADIEKVRNLLNAINGLRIDDFETDRPSDLKIYGLASPKTALEIWPSDGGKVQTLLVGRQKLKTASVFAKKGDGDTVFLIPQTFEKNLDLKPNDFKDKTVLQFDASQVTRLTVSHDDKTIVYVKNAQGRWEAVGRPNANDEGTSLLSQLALLTISDFVIGGAKTGLSHPAYGVEVTLANQKVRKYYLGNREKQEVYLSVEKSKDIYLVPANLISSIEPIFNAPPTIPSPVTTSFGK